jgi:hypothetical protein
MAPVLMAALIGLGLPLLACQGEETLGDKAKDSLDMREHEGLKDAGEDAKEAVEDAGEAVKEELD